MTELGGVQHDLAESANTGDDINEDAVTDNRTQSVKQRTNLQFRKSVTNGLCACRRKLRGTWSMAAGGFLR